ncbi:hypothetical protein Cgig2_000690 [Carnegiea gigantea]|uniref:Fe2OG dioxygenase domain-containing protein n=1 Tax=Carnegiea gigantea TaxID=171969 RepID=A0A9Q1QG15_9CARY|nr:hypothetical protein Cgig2_000690 [Carnegiea gigantea]
MAELLSNWFEDERILENYVFPPEKRPGELVVPIGKANVPIVDLHDEENNTIHHIMKVSQDFGLFQMRFILSYLLLLEQVVNHEISAELMTGVMKGRLQYINISICPSNTIEFFRATVGPFVIALRDLGSRILGLISKGLGLESKYFAKELSEDCTLTINHYPPCPNPSLSLGINKHTDPSLITILLTGEVPGLQALMDGQWMGVETLPNALLVIIGNQLEVVSNGKLKSGIHRVVTNAKEARSSAAFFINPTKSCIVEPAKALVEAQNSEPLYKAFQYKDFFKAYTDASSGDIVAVLEAFKIKNS